MKSPLHFLCQFNSLSMFQKRPRYCSGQSHGRGLRIELLEQRQLLAGGSFDSQHTTRGAEGETVPLFEFFLDLTNNQGTSLVNPTSRQATFSVGDVANLEFLFTDQRTGDRAAQGLFEAYTNILSTDTGWFEPVVNESQVFSFSTNVLTQSTGGTIVLRQQGRAETAIIDVSAFRASPAAAIRQAIVQSFGYTNSQISTINPPNFDESTFEVRVRFVGLEFDDVDIPNFTVDLTNIVSPGAVSGSVREVAARLADGFFNPEALRVAYDAVVDRRSRTGINQQIYANGVPIAVFNDNPNDGVPNGFTRMGNFGPGTAGGLLGILPADVYNPRTPFEVFSIPVRFTRAISQSELRLDLVLRDNGDTGLSAYGDLPGAHGEEARSLLPDEILLGANSRILVAVGINLAPVAVNDTDGTFRDEPVEINIAANDSDPDGSLDLDSIVIVTPPGRGSATPIGGGIVRYFPEPGFTGIEFFEYTIRDDRGRTSNVGRVSVQTVGSRLQNPRNLTDVNASGQTNPLDALLIINRLSRSIRQGLGASIPVLPTDEGPNFYDTDGNLAITANDALRVINQISRNNRALLSGGEGEAAPTPVVASVPVKREALADNAFITFGNHDFPIDFSTPKTEPVATLGLLLEEAKRQRTYDRAAAADIAWKDATPFAESETDSEGQSMLLEN